MAINYPGPFEVRINYVTDEPAVIASHQLRMSCIMSIEANPGDPFSDWYPEQKGGSNTIPLDTHVSDLLNVVKPYHNTAVAYVSAELWEYAPNSFDAVYRSAYSPSNEPTGVPATVPASQAVFTFRTQLGGIMKFTWMGVHISPNVSIPFGGAGYPTAVATYILGNTAPWIGRDGSFPIAALAFHPGQNEALWKKVNRP